MNRNQFQYQLERVQAREDLLDLVSIGSFSFLSVSNFALYQNPLLGLISGLIGVGLGYSAHQKLIARTLILAQARRITKNVEQYPLEHVNKIIIDDALGLDMLLSRTREANQYEWGTCLKSNPERDSAIINKIQDIEEAQTSGLISDSRTGQLRIAAFQADEEGYNGGHHYHPTEAKNGARNFAVHIQDRYNLINWINLLTFNLPTGPEIIGFNRRDTFIPKTTSKTELKRAGYKEIMEYLKT